MRAYLLTFYMTLLMSISAYADTATLPAVGTSATLGKVDGVEIEVIVQSPSAQVTPLQIICLFEYAEDDIYTSPPALPKASNGLVHVDEALKGLITDIRKTKKFEGKALETLLIEPKANAIPAKKLLCIGLGSRDNFKPEMMRLIGIVGMREALRLNVSNYSHASDLKDAGYSSPTSDVAGYVIQGALEAYRTQMDLQKQNASGPLTVKKVTVLSGQTFFDDTKEGINKVITEFKE